MSKSVWDRIEEARARHNVLEHPFYVRWSDGELTSEELARYSGKLAKAKWDREARVLLTPAEALQRAEDERLAPGDRYERLPDENGLMVIFDNANGVSRFVDLKTGPAYLAKLNALTRIPTPAEGLPLTEPVTADPGTVPGGN